MPEKKYTRMNAAKRAARLRIISWRLAQADFCNCLNPKITAQLLGVTDFEAARARISPEYLEHIEELKVEWGKRASNAVQEDVEKLKMGIALLVPRALQVLSDALDDPKADIRVRAAQEIIDRDGNFPKVSKVQNVIEKSVLPDVDKEIVAEFHKHIQ